MKAANYEIESGKERADEPPVSEDRSDQSEVGKIVTECADPIVRKILFQRLNLYLNFRRKGVSQPEAEDLYQTAILKLISSLTPENLALLRNNKEQLNNYIAAITHNVCNDFLREKYPERNRLKNRVRDLTRRNRGLACWKIDDDLVCGLTIWSGRGESERAEKLVKGIREEGLDFQVDGFRAKDYIHFPVEKLVNALLKWCEGPIELNHLVYLTATLGDVRDNPEETIDEENHQALQIIGGSGRYSERTETRDFLATLWRETCDLPMNQRRTFVLTTFDHTGESFLHRVVREQIIAMSQIYSDLGYTKDELTAIWGKLPMDSSTAAIQLKSSAGMIAKWRHRALKKLGPIFGVEK